jgi:hypothetical protein
MLLQRPTSGNLMTLRSTSTANGAYSGVTFSESVAGSSLQFRYGYFTAEGGSGAAANLQLFNPASYSLVNVNTNQAAIGIGLRNGAGYGTLHVRNNWPTTGATRMIVQAGPGQGTTALQQWQAANATGEGTVLASIGADGQATFPSVTLTTGTRPTCDATQRGKLWYVAGGTGTADTLEACVKDAADAYGWKALY